MSMQNWEDRPIRSIVSQIVDGLMYTFIIVMAIFWIIVALGDWLGVAQADDVVRIYERGGMYQAEYPAVASTATEDMIISFMGDGTYSTTDMPPPYEVVEVYLGCKENNAFLEVLRRHANERQAQNPELADIYEPAQQAIDRAWCKQ